ncbi:Uu.00g145330.m01.CDS01 [Anthostomella pinea]|uniref:Uu.00g145330.m01.CDS01 n=1 Tax=Anthostomella pinea TaxID=933095 RepID=A0AAI8VS66_9PEZI|nr:Uu.00g145330.m01.CDS01 [Anthostomella pinea]
MAAVAVQPPVANLAIPDVAHETLVQLAKLFIRYEAQELYGLHLIHGHSQAPEGTVMVGTCTDHDGKPLCWTKIILVSTIDRPVHGHIYRLQSERFHPYEYREGELDSRFLSVSGFVGPRSSRWSDLVMRLRETNIPGWYELCWVYAACLPNLDDRGGYKKGACAYTFALTFLPLVYVLVVPLPGWLSDLQPPDNVTTRDTRIVAPWPKALAVAPDGQLCQLLIRNQREAVEDVCHGADVMWNPPMMDGKQQRHQEVQDYQEVQDWR